MNRRRIPCVRQFDQADCGAACLASVCRYYGYRVPLSRIRQYAGTDAAGTSMAGMVRAAEQLGFSAQGVRATAEAFDQLPLPAVAHLLIDGSLTHFVVVYELRDGSLKLMDPAEGIVRRLSVAEFADSWTGVLLLLHRPDGAPAPTEGKPPAVRLFQLWRGDRRAVLLALGGAVAYTALGVSTAVFVQKVLDDVVPRGDLRLLGFLTLAMLCIALARGALRYFRDMVLVKTGQTMDRAILGGFFAHLLDLPQQFFDSMRVGEIVSRLNDAVRIRVFLNEVLLQVVVNSLIVILSMSLMVFYSPRLALLVSVSVPLYAILYSWTNRANRRDQRATMVAAAEYEAHIVESVEGVATIRGLGLQDHTRAAGSVRLDGLLRPIFMSGRTASLSGAGAELVSNLSIVGLIWLGAAMVVQQQLTLGELMSFFTLAGYLAPPLLALLAANRQLQEALIATDRLYEVMDLERESDAAETMPAALDWRTIRLQEVHFRYGSRPPLFRGLSFSVERATVTAIVGQSGCGKSTIASLLQRQRLPERGRILMGEQDIAQLPLSLLRRRIAVVPQDVVLFSGTLQENIAPGESNPDDRGVSRLLEALALEDLLASLPLGLNTPLGGRGLLVSGGQRQRIAIARALYRKPQVLVLDEATAGLDSNTERKILSTLLDLRESGMTIIFITHRLASVANADRIVVIEGGRATGEGTHLELISTEATYQRLWMATEAPSSPTASPLVSG